MRRLVLALGLVLLTIGNAWASTEMFSNGGYESSRPLNPGIPGFTYRNLTKSVTLANSGTAAHTGSVGGVLTPSGTYDGLSREYYWEDTTGVLIPGHQYTLSAWEDVTGAPSNLAAYTLYVSSDVDGFQGHYGTAMSAVSSWQQLALTWTQPAATDTRLGFSIRDPADSGWTVYVDDLSLMDTTPPSPSPTPTATPSPDATSTPIPTATPFSGSPTPGPTGTPMPTPSASATAVPDGSATNSFGGLSASQASPLVVAVNQLADWMMYGIVAFRVIGLLGFL